MVSALSCIKKIDETKSCPINLSKTLQQMSELELKLLVSTELF